MPFTDFRDDACWKRSIKTFKDKAPADHPLCKIPGVCWWTTKLDLLHMMDLGVAAHIYGNLLWVTIEDILPGSRPSSMNAINTLIAKIYHDLETPSGKRLPKLNLSDVCAGGKEYPVLKQVKGRRARACAGLLHLALKLADMYASDHTTGKHMLALCKAMDIIYNLCDRSIRPEPVAAEFGTQCRVALAHSSWLAKDAMNKSQYRWQLCRSTTFVHISHHSPSTWPQGLAGAMALSLSCH